MGPKVYEGLVARWNQEVIKVLGTEEAKARMKAKASSPAAARLRDVSSSSNDIEKWRRVMREAKSSGRAD